MIKKFNKIQEMGSAEEKESYWNGYYKNVHRNKMPVPSQFAVFIGSEISDVDLVVDIACGTGRDSLFFSQHFPLVVGVDGSENAIKACQEMAPNGSDNLEFVQSEVGSEKFSAMIAEKANTLGDRSMLVYARFFLHAITVEEEAVFFDALASAMRPGDRLALEYRTPRDASGQKETATHYRRFVSVSNTDVALAAHGFSVEYSVEGYGLAKYKKDDAYVARTIYLKG